MLIGYIAGRRMKIARETSQAIQRAKVGLIGLLSVIMLIGLASTIMRAVNRERPVAAAGGSRPEVVANMAMSNDSDSSGEPLADLGVTASAENAVVPSSVR